MDIFFEGKMVSHVRNWLSLKHVTVATGWCQQIVGWNVPGVLETQRSIKVQKKLRAVLNFLRVPINS